jgi:hypothetical protein
MTRLFTYATIVICLGTTATLAVSPRILRPGTTSRTSDESLQAADGAFRDGLYLGKLAAEAGQPVSLAVGRWSTDQDRAMFTAGYRRGYDEALTIARTERAQPSE